MASVNTGTSKLSLTFYVAARCVLLLGLTSVSEYIADGLKTDDTLETATRTLRPCHLGSDDFFVSLFS